MAKLSLKWPGHGRYRIRQREGSGPTLVQRESYRELVREGAAIPYSADRVDALYERFAAARGVEGMKAFAEKYGLLRRGNREGIDDMLALRRAVRKLLAAKKADAWDKARTWFKDFPEAARLTAKIGEDEAGRPQLEFEPRDLFGFMVAQLVQDWATGATYRWCDRPGCDEFFYYGPGTGRRETARYCSPKCQASHAYMTRKEESR
jgi:hypothetical protein